MTSAKPDNRHDRLGELPATAICGNDITSSCLYVSALAIVYAGAWAWLVLLAVAFVLYLFRTIYAEVVGALPLNGGAYNALLNTTSKSLASLAACLTILSYMATAVISATEAMHYVASMAGWDHVTVIEATVALLFFFMLLTIIGLGESSKVAVAIFIFHLATLTTLVVAGLIFLSRNGLGNVVDAFAVSPGPRHPIDLTKALFFGFSAAMLGISGFESSANFVEEQAPGVFAKTLRNMWIAVSVFNPLMAFLALGLVPIDTVPEHKEALLAHMGDLAAGGWLSAIVSIDAALVLSGAVLTSYVGVTGLIRRMTLDRCLPQGLLKTNRRGTSHRIIGGFFLLATSVLLITNGELGALAGVYTISFLGVMALFGFGNILLKVRRAKLPRLARASWPALLTAISAVLAGLAGNVLMNPTYFRVFLAYGLPTVAVVLVMLNRIELMEGCLFLLRAASESVGSLTAGLSARIRAKIDEINSQQVVFFSRGDNPASLNKVMLYVRKNEHTNRIKVVIVYQDPSEIPERMERDLKFLDEVYPVIDIEFVKRKGKFGPKLIQELSKEWNVPANFMFIGSPGDGFIYGLEELGGVRLII